LETWAQQWGQPGFRGRQLHDWLYGHGARSLEAITVLPKAWRQQLLQGLPGPASLAIDDGEPGRWLLGRSRLLHRSDARDGTTKLLLATDDGLAIETVGIPTGDRLTVCVSSQVGCPMACSFCATGKGGLQRSLAVHEIVDQVLSIREAMGRRPSHVVFMGMGEPLLNSEAVLAAIECLCRDLGMAQRQITVSTVGVPKTLPTLAERALEKLGRAQFTLAVSLHAPDQRLRETLIPTAHAYPLANLLEDCRHYVALTGRRVSFEYILLGGLNDQPRHADALAALLRGFQSHVNLIAYNPIEEENFQRPSPQAVEAFRATLARRRVAVSVRASRGLDQDAACGQLRRRLVGPGERINPGGRQQPGNGEIEVQT
jgi:23S rRNA (adenine2503-C2)-methyltransferase